MLSTEFWCAEQDILRNGQFVASLETQPCLPLSVDVRSNSIRISTAASVLAQVARKRPSG